MKLNTENRVLKLSKHVEFSRLNKEEYILSNKKHNHYLKINKKTYELLNLINGKRTLCEIQKQYNNTHINRATLSQLENLLYVKLVKYGILEGFQNKVKPYCKPKYLKLSFTIFNEKIVSEVVKYFLFLFNPIVALIVIVGCISILFTLGIVNFNVYKSFNLQESVFCFFSIMTISVTFHELGHATAAKVFGAKHGGIGGGFYLLTPVYYADVTDIWRLKKWQRIIVNLSGIYFEVIFCAIIGVFGFIFNNFILQILAIIVCLNTFFNLNPFLRSDGYWILSDLIEKPNLLYHSFDKIKDIFALLKSRRHQISWDKKDFILFIYGLISYSFIVLFLYYILFQNSNSILDLPKNIINFVKGLFNKEQKFNLLGFSQIIIPLLFYYFLFIFLSKAVRKWKNKTINPE